VVDLGIEIDRFLRSASLAETTRRSYRFDLGVYERDWQYVYDYHWSAYPLEVTWGGAGGTFGPARRWSTVEA